MKHHPDEAALKTRAPELREAQKSTWEARWSSADFNPKWGGRSVPLEVEAALLDGSLPSHGRVLDIGCGEGEVAAWFHAHGYESLGIDIAEGAIARARARSRDLMPESCFRTFDISAGVPEGAPFDIIIESGCLHGIPEALHASYADNVARASVDGTHLLLFMRISRGAVSRVGPLRWRTPRIIERWLQRRYVNRLFQGRFSLIRVRPVDLRGVAASAEMPGMLYRLIRRTD